MIYFLLGFMGAGKSSLGKYAAKRQGMEFIDLDHWIEETEGVSIAEIFNQQGEEAFRKLERSALEKVCTAEREQDLLLSCGGGTPCFYDNVEYMNQRGTTIYLKLSPGMLANRLKNAKSMRPLLEGVADLEGFIREKLVVREPFYAKAVHIIMGKTLSRNAFARWLGELNGNPAPTQPEN